MNLYIKQKGKYIRLLSEEEYAGKYLTIAPSTFESLRKKFYKEKTPFYYPLRFLKMGKRKYIVYCDVPPVKGLAITPQKEYKDIDENI